MQLKFNLVFILKVLLFMIYSIQYVSLHSKEDSACKSPGKDCGCSKLKREHNDPSDHFKYTEKANIDNKTPSETTKDNMSYKRTNQMVYLRGGIFTMGTDKPFIIRDGEGPARKVQIRPFYIDVYEVSNAEFELFVNETEYVTEAEKFGDSFVLESRVSKEIQKDIHQAVSAAPWWVPVKGAYWKHPEGPDTTLKERKDHPVLHISWNDAVAFCTWAGKRLPTEAEFEYAMKGGSDDTLYPWGNKLKKGGKYMANLWQGKFPVENTAKDGFEGTCPITAFPPNGYGLYNMVGNVWEWTADWWTIRHKKDFQDNPVWVNRLDLKLEKTRLRRVGPTCVISHIVTVIAVLRGVRILQTRRHLTWDFDVLRTHYHKELNC